MKKNILLILILGVLLIGINQVSAVTYYNTTNGFSTADFGASSPYGITTNGSDFWIADNVDNFVYHTNRLGVNQSDGFSILGATTLGVYGILTNSSSGSPKDFWITVGASAKFISHLSNLGVNQSDGIDTLTAGVGAFQQITTNGSDFWIMSYNKKVIYHLDRLGNNMTDGFSTSNLFTTGTPIGITTYGNDFWISTDVPFVFHTDGNGVNQSDGFDSGIFGIGGAGGIATNGSNFFISDPSDGFIYDIWCDGCLILPFTISIDSPADLFSSTIHNTWFNGTSSYTTGLVMNISLFINGIRNYTYNYGLGNSTNLTIYRNLPIGVYNFTFESCNNDSVTDCIFAVNRTINILSHSENSFSFNQSSFETKRETFKLNITSSTGTITNVKFNYNGTNYTGTATAYGSNYILSASLDIPLATTVGNKSFSYIWTLDGIQTQSTTYSNFINRTIFGLCNTSLVTKYYNLSFKDESTNLFMNATIPSSNWVYYLGSGSVNKTLSFINNSQNWEYNFCSLPSSEVLNTNINIQYSNTDYPQRLYQDILNLFNITTNKTLYLLSSTDGIYVSFQLLSSFGDPLSGVSVMGNRTIGSSTTTVALGTTDSSGLVTFWLNPDFEHTFSFTKTDYDSEVLTLYPTQSSYTVTLGGGTSQTILTDYTKGVTISIKPLNDLKNNTNYEFNYTLSTTTWLFDSWGFQLYYGNGSYIGSQSSAVNTGGILQLSANTLNQTRIIMKYFYVINSTYTNGTKIWQISKSSDFSISHFFSDLNLYITSNIFGINGDDGDDTFGKAFISVLILIFVAGTLSYKFGIQSEPAIMGMIFGVVLFLNSVSFIPNPDFLTGTGITLGNFVVFVTGLIMIASIFRGESR